MAYSIKKCKEISERVTEIGIFETSIEYGISADSVKRALRYLKAEEKLPNPIESCVINGGRRVLIVGDLHCPFDLDGYLDFCKEKYMEHACNTVVFIGDVIDNHYSSYHETDPNGLSGKDELDLAIDRLAPYYESFDQAYVCIGNHDRMCMRRAVSSNLPTRWIRSYAEVLQTPNWIFTDYVTIDGVEYIHGENGTARSRSLLEMNSVVQGHRHTEMYTQWSFGKNRSVFGMQVGCGVDASSYAMGYCKHGRKPAIGCGVVIDGKTAFNEVMEL
tara:strand:- start:883 stop:1704 length:822 start_codon:yes stop_codon:yes gene_type:complete